MARAAGVDARPPRHQVLRLVKLVSCNYYHYYYHYHIYIYIYIHIITIIIIIIIVINIIAIVYHQ